MIKHALYYHQLGFSIIPICGPYYSNGDNQKAKKPLIKWAEFQKRKPTKEEIIKWFTSYPKANIAIVTGEVSGVVVIDFDSEEAVIWAKQKGLLNTSLVRTARGLHAYYKYPQDKHIRNLVNLDNMKIDIRAEGGYVVAPPSIHTNGHVYKWIKGHSPFDLGIKELPGDLIEINPVKSSFPNFKDILLNGVTEGTRNVSLTRLAGILFKLGLNLEETLEFALKWNKFCQPPLDEAEVKRTVKSIWMRELEKKQAEQKICPVTPVYALLQETYKNRLN